jgi:hypothetical protein
VHWNRRRDLEGGKELGVWLLLDTEGNVEKELYVESHEYRGEGFDVYTATPEGDWTHLNEYDNVNAAFERAREYLEASEHAVSEQ